MFSLQRHHNVVNVSCCNPLALSFQVSKRYIFILFCATALSARMPSADAYTVVALYTSAGDGPHYEHYEFESHAGLPRNVVEKRALEGVQLARGIDPKIVLSTGKSGYFAIAISQEQNSRIIGWSGPLPSADRAAKEAIAKCKKRGGTDPRIKAHWADGMSGEKQ